MVQYATRITGHPRLLREQQGELDTKLPVGRRNVLRFNRVVISRYRAIHRLLADHEDLAHSAPLLEMDFECDLSYWSLTAVPDTSALLGDRLVAFGFDVIETHKSGHALLLIKNWAHTRRPFNGILLNLEPPFPDGLDILQELVELHPEIPVIVFCSWPDADLLVEARHRGARDIIIKPFNCDLLELKCIEHFVVPPYDESENPFKALSCRRRWRANRRVIQRTLELGGLLQGNPEAFEEIRRILLEHAAVH